MLPRGAVYSTMRVTLVYTVNSVSMVTTSEALARALGNMCGFYSVQQLEIAASLGSALAITLYRLVV